MRCNMTGEDIADGGALVVIPGQVKCAKSGPARCKPLRHVQHRRMLLLQDDGYAKAHNPVREISLELQQHDISLRRKMLVQLSPHPN